MLTDKKIKEIVSNYAINIKTGILTEDMFFKELNKKYSKLEATLIWLKTYDILGKI